MTYVLCYSGGKDSTATLIRLVKELGIIPIVTFSDTGNESKDTYNYIRYTSDLLVRWGGEPIVWLKGEYDYLSLAIKKKRFPSIKARVCTEWLKVVPFLRWLEVQPFSENCTVVTGIRRLESRARSKRAEHEPDNLYGRPQWNPIIDWTVEAVFGVHRKYNVDINPMYKLGFKRVGCFPCCCSGRSELVLIDRHYPERIKEISKWEALVGRSFFAPRKHLKTTGEPIIWSIEQHVDWATKRLGGQLELGSIKTDSTFCAYAGLGVCE